MTARDITCFKAYDLRGRLGTELDDDVAWRVGRAFAARPPSGMHPRVVVGRDGRESSPGLTAALIRGLTEGVDTEPVEPGGQVGILGHGPVIGAGPPGRNPGGGRPVPQTGWATPG